MQRRRSEQEWAEPPGGGDRERAGQWPDDGSLNDPPGPRSSGRQSPGWQPTRALRRAVGLIVVLLIGAVSFGRPDLAVLAVPLAVGTVWVLRRRPAGLPRVTVTSGTDEAVEGEEIRVTVSVDNRTGVPLVPVWVDAYPSGWLVPDPDTRPVATALHDGMVADVGLRVVTTRWGRHPFDTVDVEASACGALLMSRPVPADALELRVHPATEHFEAVEAMPRAAGLAGTHRARRPGEGGELAGVRPFVPGDRLRRIDWRVSLRTRQLHVAATLSDREAELVLLLDALHDAGVSGGASGGGSGGTASALDIMVRAAAGVAEHYLHRGDRVSLLEFGPRYRQLRAAGGRWHYQAVRDWLLDVRVVAGTLDPATWLTRPHLLAPDALIVAFTPLVDERSAELLARLARAGRFVVAVDTLPVSVDWNIDDGWREPALALWRIERQNTIDELREHGVPVVAWRGSGSLDEVLRDVSRMASTARPVPR